jgi:hypothetical protein
MGDDAEWNQGFAELKKYVSAHRDANVPAAYISSSNFKLGIWLLTQKRVGTRLAPRKLRLMQDQGVVFS